MGEWQGAAIDPWTPKVIPDPFTPSRRATPETALGPFKGWSAHAAGGLRLSSTPLDTPRLTPMLEIQSCLDFETMVFLMLDENFTRHSLKFTGVWRGVSKGVKDSRRLPALLAGHLPTRRATGGPPAHRQGIEG
jgi:hypothetical protein